MSAAPPSVCRRCTYDTPAEELDDCVRCRSAQICPACMIEHNCDMRARMYDARTIREETTTHE